MRIVFGTDGSATAAAATRFLADFPFPSGSEVLLVTVVEDLAREHELLALPTDERARAEAAIEAHHTELHALLETESAQLRDAGFTVTTDLRTGHPAAAIIQAAEDHDADLVVVGSHGITGFRRFMIGSVSHHVLQSARRSVLVVPGSDTSEDADRPEAGRTSAEPPWQITVGFDGSEPADEAVAFCSRLELTQADRIHLITVLPIIRAFRMDILQELDPIWQQRKAAARAALDDAASRAAASGAQITTALREATDVSEAILETAEELEADLVIIGNKGASAVQDFLTGSTTPQIARHADRAVLAVR